MRVLLKPNLLKPAHWEHGITTHPAVIQTVAELVVEAGGTVWIGDSPSGPIEENALVMRKTGAVAAAEAGGGWVVPFDGVVWKRLNGGDYLIAPPVLEADIRARGLDMVILILPRTSRFDVQCCYLQV